MKITVEISMYPLNQEYEDSIVKFIKNLKEMPEIDIETNGMSTQIFGDYDVVMSILNQSIKEVLENERCVFALKMAEGERRKENIPESIK